jgi:hypothetical protein
LDIWQATPSHVDIYEDPFSDTPPSLLDLTHTESYVDATPGYFGSHDQFDEGDWDLASLDNTSFHSTYHPQHEIDAFMRDIAELRPELANVVSLGHSGEGREVWALKLHKQDDEQQVGGRGNREIDPSNKLGFLIVGALHAREVRLIHLLLEQHRNSESVSV